MNEQFSRTRLLLGDEAMGRLAAARVAVFGIGGVGGHAAEALARSGVGEIDLIDSDTVSESNINRQLIATYRTIGRYKVDVMEERIRDINPRAVIHTYRSFFLPENAEQFPFAEYDYVVDAVDTVTAKIELVLKAQAAGVPVISSMGAGNKLDASAFRVADIYQTSVCPLAKVMRRELKKRGVGHLKVVYSQELPLTPECGDKEPSITPQGCSGEPPITPKGGSETPPSGRRAVPGSVAFVPSVAGLILAGEVVKDLAGII